MAPKKLRDLAHEGLRPRYPAFQHLLAGKTNLRQTCCVEEASMEPINGSRILVPSELPCIHYGLRGLVSDVPEDAWPPFLVLFGVSGLPL